MDGFDDEEDDDLLASLIETEEGFGEEDDDDDDLLASLIETEQCDTLNNGVNQIQSQKSQTKGSHSVNETSVVKPVLITEQSVNIKVQSLRKGANSSCHIIQAESCTNAPDEIVNVAIPESFPFPFTPYDIQLDFMKSLYTCLEKGNIGIFESPTGTGKSLSLICGAVKWLRDYQEKQKKQIEDLKKSDSKVEKENDSGSKDADIDWITEFKVKKEQEEKFAKIKSEQEQIEKRESKLKEMQSSSTGVRKRKYKHLLTDEFDSLISGAAADVKKACRKELDAIDKETAADLSEAEKDDSDLLLADYNSEEEQDEKDKKEDIFAEDEDENITKIYYCSRTHSQLSQFVHEVVKSPYNDVRVISLGSRQNLCINPLVSKLKSLTMMNDKCLDLQQKKSKKKPGCPHYKHELLHSFKDKALLEVSDIEQLVVLGRQTKACPYYGSRYAVPLAEIVALPYNTLLHQSTRDACGIKLAGSIVIIDEAHNLLETINNIHSVEVTAAQVTKAHSQLSQYDKKFKTRLKAKNLLYVRQILFVLDHLAAVMGANVNYTLDSQTSTTKNLTSNIVKLLTINNFLFEAKLDNFNMFKLLRYCKRSQISKKLNGFSEKYRDSVEVKIDKNDKKPAATGVSKFLQELKEGNDKKDVPSVLPELETGKSGYMSSPLMQIESFLAALTNADKDGRVVLSRSARVSQSSLKFLMLNAAVHFGSVLKEARSVVVAGGTMQPVSEFKDQLFFAAGIPQSRVTEFACGHVIPGRQLLPLALASGSSGVTFDFTYQNRDKPALLAELGWTIGNLCSVIPGGIVCFLPSYDYEARVYAHWEKSGILSKIQCKKRVFREPRRSGLGDQVLGEYTDCIRRSASWPGSITGALLLSVVGGKMSEGINFSDDLGRCVVMVGLPYPNNQSPELKEKMTYLNANFPRDREGRQAGQVHYENLCMKAVNQSIGRAIRHRDDYATILLLDQRYLRPSVSSKLPSWISKHLQKEEKFSAVMTKVPRFFDSHKSASQQK